MTGAVRGILSERKTARRVSITQTNYRKYLHVEEPLIFGNKYGQTRIVLRTI